MGTIQVHDLMSDFKAFRKGYKQKEPFFTYSRSALENPIGIETMQKYSGSIGKHMYDLLQMETKTSFPILHTCSRNIAGVAIHFFAYSRKFI